MAVGQPADPTQHEVEVAFGEVMQLLKEKYGVQTMEDPAWAKKMLGVNLDWTEERKTRNEQLKKALFGLLQLERWESF